MSKDSGYYVSIPLKRTIQEMFELSAKKSGENYCCCHKPLLVIPLDHIILDELHLMLTITDIMLEKLIEDAMQWDARRALHLPQKDQWKSQNFSKNLWRQSTTVLSLSQYGGREIQMARVVGPGTGLASWKMTEKKTLKRASQEAGQLQLSTEEHMPHGHSIMEGRYSLNSTQCICS